jgi:S-adenosylmethionine synthetase
MPIVFAHQLTRKLAQVRKDGVLDFLRPDGKSQVTIEYNGDTPVRIDAVVVSSQHKPDATEAQIREGIIEEVIKTTLPAQMLDEKTKYFVNPTGRFVMGGPMGDTGLTGRKIIVDTYGGQGSHGGGCFSGKDPSKVDRSASYMARYIAKNIVAAGLADKCEVQFAYAIGIADPVSVMINSFGTSKVSPDSIAAAVRDVFPLRPRDIIEALDLLRPIYTLTASYGHFGRQEPEFTWEKIDKVDELKSAAGA